MLATVKTSDLTRPLAAAAQVAKTGANAMPVLSAVLLKAEGEKLRLEATDLEVSLSWAVPAEVEEQGAAALPARSFNDLVRRLSAETLRISGSGEDIEVGYGSGAVKFKGLDPADFPAFPEMPGDVPVVLLTRQGLEKALGRVAFAVGTEAVFSGVLFEAEDGASTWAATDTHRLAYCAGPEVGAPVRALMPLKALEAAAESTSDFLQVAFGPQAVEFRAEDLTVHTRLLAGKFPAWRAVLPKEFACALTVDAKALTETLGRALLVARQAEKQAAEVVRLDFGPEGLVVKASGQYGSFAERVDAVLEGEPGTVHFNGTYLLDALKPLNGGRAVIALGPEFRAAVVRAENDTGYACLVLPVIVNGSEAGA